MKPPTTTVIGPSDPIVVRSPATARYDWEAELAVVIGVGGRDIPLAGALGHVAGLLRRQRHHRPRPAQADRACRPRPSSTTGSPPSPIDGSLPLGPGITPAFQVPDPQDLRMRLWVNGELQQDESTADMICTVAELIAAASEIVTLEPGDVIPTGTPSGVGAGRGLYLQPGDVVRTTIDGLGTLHNAVTDPSGGTP